MRLRGKYKVNETIVTTQQELKLFMPSTFFIKE